MQTRTIQDTQLKPLALVRCSKTEAHPYRLVEFVSVTKQLRRELIPTTLLSQSPRLKEFLVERDYPPISDRNHWREVIETLSAEVDSVIDLADCPGFYGKNYLSCSGRLIGCDEDLRPYVLDPKLVANLANEAQKGTLQEWKDKVAPLATHSSRLMLALCSAFSGPLVRLVDMESGGFHIHGSSSTGKTSCLSLPASVFGGQEFVRSWDMTDTAVEETAAGHNDSLLILDELRLLDPTSTTGARRAMKIGYQISQGQGKKRTKRYQTWHLSWRLALLSTGEESMAEYARSGGRTRMAGETVRLIDVPADAGNGLGLFESLPESVDSASEFAELLTTLCEQYHGTAQNAYIEYLLDRLNTDGKKLRRQIKTIMEKFMTAVGADRQNGQEYRIAKRFALAYAAGILAKKAKILPIKRIAIKSLIKKCYEDSLFNRKDPVSDQVSSTFNSLIHHIQQEEWLDLRSSGKNSISSRQLKETNVFHLEMKGREIVAVRSSYVKGLVRDSQTLKLLTEDLKASGKLLLDSKGKATRQIPVRVNSRGTKTRCYCFYKHGL